MISGRAVKLGASLVVSAFFVWLIARSIPLDSLGAALSQARPDWIAFAVLLFVADYACRIHRWRAMLLPHSPGLSWSRCSVPFMASIAANNVLPFRAGDALRAFGFSRWLGVPNAALLATLLVERLMDLLVLLAALGLALTLLEADNATLDLLVGSSSGLLIALAALIVAVLVYPQGFEPLARAAVRLVEWRAPGLAAKLRREMDRVFSTLRQLSRGTTVVTLLIWSVAAWALEAGVFYAVARGIPEVGNAAAAWLAMPVGTLSTLLPSTPGYVGTFHFFVARTVELLGNTAVAATAFAVLVHLVLWLSATLWGGCSFVFWMLVRSSSTPEPIAKGVSE